MHLNVEQKKIIFNKPSGHLLLKGVAGSGKTTVAVNRVPFLMKNYCIGSDDYILMVTFNKTLANYIKYIYEKVEEENKVEVLSLFSSSNDRLEVKTIDQIIYSYYMEYKKANKVKMELLVDYNKKHSILQQSILEIQKNYNNVNIMDLRNLNFLKDEIEWIKSCGYTELEEYQNVDRLGRMSSNNSDGPQKLLKNSSVRNAIFDLMLLYNKKLAAENLNDFQDMAQIALEQAKKKIFKKYTHIIVDESQDLTRTQLLFIKQLYNEKNYSSILFVADTAQSIYSQAWMVKGRSFASIGFDMTGKSNSLAKNYRTTTQIAQAAYSLIEKDRNIIEDDNFVKPSLIDKQGNCPVLKHFGNTNEEIGYIIKLIDKDLINKYNYRDIAIIARTKNQLSEVSEIFQKANIPCKYFDTKEPMDFQDDSIKLLTMHSIKGLEFKIVILMGLNDKVIPNQNSIGAGEDKEFYVSMERRLLYVGMTRATERLYMTCSGVPSRFLSEINGEYLKLNDESSTRRFYNVSFENYLFKEKVSDLYSNEEKVRQWFIKELLTSYKYPADLIEVEYKVNAFSKIGLVDCAVSIFNNKNKIPYIFIEFKRKNKGIEDCIGQLKSYMSASKQVRYGVATDGNEFVVIDNEFNEISDIPRFDVSMLPSSIESFEYVDLRHNTKYDFLRDCNNIAEIIVDENGAEFEYTSKNLSKLNIYSEIAAGKPILINTEIQDEFYLPHHWVKDSINSFILKIKGESMIEANIDNGDYVIIKKQSTADTRDIVAVDIDGNATLKRFIPMGDIILLMAENKNYEPIQVRAEQANIIGIAVGIIKRK